MVRSHELADGSLDLGALFGGELALLGVGARDESCAAQGGYDERFQDKWWSRELFVYRHEVTFQ
jgi:hypothetical protein